MKKEIMIKEHPLFNEFIEKLDGPEGCDFREENNKLTWNCKGGKNKDFAKKILKKYYPQVDIKKTLEYFHSLGGHCDCEIIFNVAGE